MKRDQVLAKLKAVESKLEKAYKVKAPEYNSVNVYIPGIGDIKEINELQDLVKAHAVITKAQTDLEGSAKELEIELSDEEFEYNGLKISDWMEDIKNRKSQIILEDKRAKLNAAKCTLEKHLSDDDKFNMDMEEIGDVLETL